MGAMYSYLMSLLYSKKLEVVLVGLENSGKTTLLQVLSDGNPVETAPTIGLNVRMVKRGGVQMKCWDLGGQSQYRQEWGRYTRGCNVIIFVVDSNALHLLPDAKTELHRLLEDKELALTPLLVVSNKIDLDPHATEQFLIKELNLISQDITLNFLIQKKKTFLELQLELWGRGIIYHLILEI
jgi:Arf/Sar family protein